MRPEKDIDMDKNRDDGMADRTGKPFNPQESEPCLESGGARYVPVSDVPADVHAAAATLAGYFESQDMRFWEFLSVCDRNLVDRQEEEISRLRDWKMSATEVISGWEDVWEAAGRPGRLGQSKSVAVMNLILENLKRKESFV